MSSVYDVLEELFVENGEYDRLPGNEQTLRNYIHHLEESGQITRDPDHKRVYDHVFDTPPGDQMLIDFGVQTLSKNQAIHFICLLLRYSRYLLVYAQDHKFSAVEACTAIYMAFCRLGGRVRQLVIDQDAVFVASETYGEVIKTRICFPADVQTQFLLGAEILEQPWKACSLTADILPPTWSRIPRKWKLFSTIR